MQSSKAENRTKAIITGDIVGFTKLASSERESLIQRLKDFLQHKLPDHLPPALGQVTTFEIQRGDSFQGVTAAAAGLRATLLIRCFLNTIPRQPTPPKPDKAGGSAASIKNGHNARIAIGLGHIDYVGTSLSLSDGEAFWNSGRPLDEMKKRKQELALLGPATFPNQEFEVSLALLEAIMAKWTIPQAQAVFAKLSSKSDEEIAQEVGITRSAVGSRTHYAGWQAISRLLDRYESLTAALS